MRDCLKLKKSNCKNCYKCIRHCPVKSIRFSGNQAHIVGNECILCGQCFVVCPQNAKEIVGETETVRVLIQSGAPVIASIAPSFAANYDGIGIAVMRTALRKLGFADAEETARGATLVKDEYERILREEQPDVLISSCCHAVNLLIQKHYPAQLPYLAPVVSPMQAHCQDIKRRIPEAKTVFIGPCVAKKDEAAYYGDTVDAVLTFEELTEWLAAEQVSFDTVPEPALAESSTRVFPTTGGILKTMTERLPAYTYMAVDGVENCMAALRDIAAGSVHACFIEMSACAGSCIGGPVMEKFHRSPVQDFMAVVRYAGKRDFCIVPQEKQALRKMLMPIAPKLEMPSESALQAILKKMGKEKPELMLNCGSCGYNTCLEKAVAIYQGKAEVSMCLPFLKDKAERFSDNIINNTPNAILILNDNYEVQQINKTALQLMHIRSAADVLGEPVIRILDPKDFMEVRESGVNQHDKRTYLAEYQKYVEQSVIYDKEYHSLFCIMRDITKEELQRESKEALSRKTVETADRVVERQMRIVQEIASLLGETAAETKIALTKLKESISDE